MITIARGQVHDKKPWMCALRLNRVLSHIAASPAAAAAVGEFAGRRVLVTGASKGIGREIALRFAEAGATVVVHYGADVVGAYATLSAMRGTGHSCIRADVSDSEQCARLVDESVAALGGLDVVVLNAGIYEEHSLVGRDGSSEISYAAWSRVWRDTLSVNLVGPANLMFLSSRAIIGSRRRAPSAAEPIAWRGSIVSVSSRGAFRGEPDAPAYGASKAGLNSLSQSMAKKLGRFGISVSVVAPGFTETPMAKRVLAGPRGPGIRNESPFERVAQPGEVADAVVFMARPASIFMSGGIVDVNGATYLRS